MRLTALAAIALAVTCVALLAAGCGGGSSGGSNTTAPPTGGGTTEGGTPKATAPNAPAGSKVIACQESAGDVEGLRATAVGCGTADRIMRRWANHRSCALPADASRGSCSLGAFQCQAVKADRGVAVSCVRPGGDIAFIRRAG